MATKKKKTTRKKKQKIKISVSWAVGVVAVVCLIALSVGMFAPMKPPGTPQVLTLSLLEDIVEVSDLATYEAIYNGIATVYDEKNPEKVKYHVSYEAEIEVGFDVQDINVNLDTEAKKVIVTIPPVDIVNVVVDFTSMDFIFINDKANTATVSETAYKACETDATTESQEQTAIKELAQQNALNYVDALVRPFVEQMDPEYEIEITLEEQA